MEIVHQAEGDSRNTMQSSCRDAKRFPKGKTRVGAWTGLLVDSGHEIMTSPPLSRLMNAKCGLPRICDINIMPRQQSGLLKASHEYRPGNQSLCAGVVRPPGQLPDQSVIGTLPISSDESESRSDQAPEADVSEN